MKSFQLTAHAVAVCKWKRTRNAFKHEATLLVNGIECESTKICYVNRTWERFEFESVLHRLIERSEVLSAEEKMEAMEAIKNSDDMGHLRTIAAVVALGEVFHAGDAKASNDWKTRMLRAGLEGRGLIMPDDWDTLTEAEKTRRLDGAIKQLCY